MRRKSFTLLELIVVIAIIGILAMISIPNFLNAQVRAKVARAKSDFRVMTAAVKVYYIDNQGLPVNGTLMSRDKSSEWAFSCLTTPIPYLSSTECCHDPFVLIDCEATLMNNTGWYPSDDFYYYFHCDREGGWLQSKGPDRMWGNHANYDASNGVISPGDITIHWKETGARELIFPPH